MDHTENTADNSYSSVACYTAVIYQWLLQFLLWGECHNILILIKIVTISRTNKWRFCILSTCMKALFIFTGFWSSFGRDEQVLSHPIHRARISVHCAVQRHFSFGCHPMCNLSRIRYAGRTWADGPISRIKKERIWSCRCKRTWRPIGLWHLEAPIFSRESAHKWRWGCQPYAPVAFTIRKIAGTHFC
jgi:hypothetical protein